MTSKKVGAGENGRYHPDKSRYLSARKPLTDRSLALSYQITVQRTTNEKQMPLLETVASV
ncbi:hypothetical protein GCM10026983_22700 [Gracilibacillus alcaliphilus]